MVFFLQVGLLFLVDIDAITFAQKSQYKTRKIVDVETSSKLNETDAVGNYTTHTNETNATIVETYEEVLNEADHEGIVHVEEEEEVHSGMTSLTSPKKL